MNIQSITSEQIKKCNKGISSYFLPVSPEIGIKLFPKKGERDRSRYKQNIANLAGLAPKVGDTIDICGFYGYYTERVIMLHTLYKFNKIPKKILNQMYDLEDQLLESCDFKIDTNWQNYGFIGKRIVCVDFGD